MSTPNPQAGDGRVVLITGGGTGIGKEIARAFAEQGDRVIICGRTPAALDAVAQELNAELGDRVETRVCDVSDREAVRAMVDGIAGPYGRIDVLVNNAGIYGPIGLAHDNDVDHWLQTVQINLVGPFLARSLG